MTPAIRALSRPGSAVAPGRRYLCLPPAGGTLSTLRGPAGAAAGAEVWGAEYPGRGDRLATALPGTLEELAEQVAGELFALFGARGIASTVLAGFSMGAFVALEVAQRVHVRCGTAPAALVVVGAVAPQRRVPGRYAVPDTVALARLLDRHGLTPVSAEVGEYALDLLREDLRLTSAYRGPATTAAPCPLAALCGGADLEPYTVDDVTEAWRSWAAGGFRTEVVPGRRLGLLHNGREIEFWARMHRIEQALLAPAAEHA